MAEKKFVRMGTSQKYMHTKLGRRNALQQPAWGVELGDASTGSDLPDLRKGP